MNYSKPPIMRVHLFGYIFSPCLLPTTALLVLLPLLISLGTWQLHRAAEKRILELNFAAHHQVIDITNIKNPLDKNYRYHVLQAKGHFDPQHLIFLDNKTHQQQIGYHVFSPFYVQGAQKILLIDRGFIASHNRKELPRLATPSEEQTISGLIYFPGKTFLLRKDVISNQWPLLVQAINLAELQKAMHQPMYPFYLLLQEGDKSDLIKDWHPVNFPSYRHTGYAIQWFLLALTLVVIYIALNTSRSSQ